MNLKRIIGRGPRDLGLIISVSLLALGCSPKLIIWLLPPLAAEMQTLPAVNAGLLAAIVFFVLLFLMLVTVRILDYCRERTFNPGKVIQVFGWFCSKPTRENLELTHADLKRLKKEMRMAGAGRRLISTVLAWQVIASIVPIIWDGTQRFVAAILPVGKIVKAVKGWW